MWILCWDKQVRLFADMDYFLLIWFYQVRDKRFLYRVKRSGLILFRQEESGRVPEKSSSVRDYLWKSNPAETGSKKIPEKGNSSCSSSPRDGFARIDLWKVGCQVDAEMELFARMTTSCIWIRLRKSPDFHNRFNLTEEVWGSGLARVREKQARVSLRVRLRSVKLMGRS